MDIEKRYFVITGMGRTASTWLAAILDQHPDCRCYHEAFSPFKWPGAFERWLATQAPVVGTVNSYARFMLPEIEEAAHPTWVFCWRDPCHLIHSIIAKGGGLINWHWPAVDQGLFWLRLRVVSAWVFGNLEAMLTTAQELGIKATHWHFDYYTTHEGVLALADHLGLHFDRSPNLDVFRNTYKNPKRGLRGLLPRPVLRLTGDIPKLIPHHSAWSKQEREAVLQVVESLHLVSQAYRDARRQRGH